MQKKVIFIIPQIGWNDIELFTIKKTLEKHKIKCETASYSTGKSISKTGKTINVDHIVCNLKTSDFDCLIFVGGQNVSSLAEYPCIIDLIKESFKENKILALLCINPALLLPKANLMKGKKVTSFKMKNNWSHDEIMKRGGVIVDSPVVIDGNIITCRDEKDAQLLAKSLVNLLKE